jgi:deoxyribonuclease V
MKIHCRHSWDLTPKEAIALQKEMADQVDDTVPLGRCELIAGADISHERFSSVIYAGVVVWRASDNTVVERRSSVTETQFPYVPGLLSFREAPAILDVFRRVKSQPDVVMIDGQGMAHPRRIGIASHIGVCLGVPTVGCAKTRLCGSFDDPGPTVGASAPLVDRGDVVGQVVRTKERANPLFVSVGNLIDLAGAVQVVRNCVRGYRVPEPTRQAHLFVNDERRKGLRGS